MHHAFTTRTFVQLLCLVVLSTSQIALGAPFTSDVDEALTIRSVLIYPVTDNASGIYSRPIEKQIRMSLSKNHHFDAVDSNYAGAILSPQQLMASESAVKKVLDSSNADALLAAKATKNPTGVTLQFYLFTKSDGKLIAQEELRNNPKFEIRDIEIKTKSHLEQLFAKLPYEGLVLSRQNNRVTLDLGKADGIDSGQIVTPVLIISQKRHPKFGFLISTEKEVLGKIKIEKAENTLSFGSIVSEKEKGAIQRNTKIAKVNMVNYKGGGFLAAPTKKSGIPNDVKKVTFGKNPKAWVPVDPPTFGRIGLILGFGTYTANSDLDSSGAIQAEESVFPQLRLNGELWITPDFSVLASLRQGVMNIDNPMSGSSPETLNVSISEYSLLFGYNILIHGDFFGPKVQVQGGYSRYSRFVDSSNPLALTSTIYSGFLLGIDGSLPVDTQNKIYLGAMIHFYIDPNLEESPETSGETSDNDINIFRFYGRYKISERIRFNGGIDFELYSSTFSGSGSRSDDAENSSERLITFNVGLEYLF